VKSDVTIVYLDPDFLNLLSVACYNAIAMGQIKNKAKTKNKNRYSSEVLLSSGTSA